METGKIPVGSLYGTPSVTASQDQSASSSGLAAITGTGNTSTLPAVKPEENKESILAKLLAKYEEKQQESIVTFITKLIEQGTAVKLDDFYEPLSKMPDEICKDLFEAIYAVFKKNEIKLLGIMRRIVQDACKNERLQIVKLILKTYPAATLLLIDHQTRKMPNFIKNHSDEMCACVFEFTLEYMFFFQNQSQLILDIPFIPQQALHVTVKENKPESFLCIWNFLVKKLGETQEEIMQTKLFSYKREHVLNSVEAKKTGEKKQPI